MVTTDTSVSPQTHYFGVADLPDVSGSEAAVDGTDSVTFRGVGPFHDVFIQSNHQVQAGCHHLDIHFLFRNCNMPSTQSFLSSEQRAHFLEHGWVKVPGGISPERVKTWTENAFVRLGWDANDKSTWTDEAYHMPRHREIPTRDHMPEAYGAASDLPLSG